MAENQHVGTGQFGEFVKRIDQRFEHVNQRFDDMKESFRGC